MRIIVVECMKCDKRNVYKKNRFIMNINVITFVFITFTFSIILI